ncbi:hypothetical protein JCM3774_001598 [Rhodotorula dairenensis]
MPPRKKGARGGKARAPTTKRQSSSTPSTGAAAAALDPVSTAGARWIVPNTASLALAASRTAGACVRRLFFDSREWVTPLRADVAALLSAFEARYDGTQSPLELMKRLWGETGWKWVMLLGCPEGRVRLDWGNSVARAFLENLRDDAVTPPLQQVAAVLALYILRAIWCEGMELFHLRVSPDFLVNLVKMTQSHAPALDVGASSTEGFPPHSADLAYAMHYLLSTSAFFLVPEETSPVPTPTRWPFAYIKPDRKEDRDRRLQAAVLLGVEAELDQLACGKIRSEVIEEAHTDSRGHKRQWNESFARIDDGDDDDEDQGSGDEVDKRARWSADSLRRARTACVESKESGHGGTADDSQQSLLVAPVYQIQADILALAKAQTRRAAESLAEDMSGLTAVASSAGDDGSGLLALLSEAEDRMSARPGSRAIHGLDAYRQAIEDLLADAT